MVLLVPDKLWNEIENISPKEKPLESVGSSMSYRTEEYLIVPFMFEGKDVSGRKYFPKIMVQVPPVINITGMKWYRCVQKDLE